MPGSPDPVQRIRELIELRDSGAISDSEFEALKAAVIGETASAPSAQQPDPQVAESDPGRNNARNVIGIALVLGGLLIGFLLYFYVAVGGDAYLPDPDSPYTNLSHETWEQFGQCTEPPRTEIAGGSDRQPPSQDFVFACYDRAIRNRNIAFALAFVGVTAGIVVLVTRRRN